MGMRRHRAAVGVGERDLALPRLVLSSASMSLCRVSCCPPLWSWGRDGIRNRVTDGENATTRQRSPAQAGQETREKFTGNRRNVAAATPCR